MAKRALPEEPNGVVDLTEVQPPPKKKVRVHVHEQRVAKREQAIAEKPFAEVGDGLIDAIVDDAWGVVGRSFFFGLADMRAILAITGYAGRVEEDGHLFNAEAIRYPVARLLAMVNRAFNAAIKKAVPDLPSLNMHPSPSPIWMAWYVWMAGARTMKKGNFTTYAAEAGKTCFNNLSYRSANTLLSQGKVVRHMKEVTHMIHIPRLMQAAAIHFRHATNVNLFYDEANPGSFATFGENELFAYYCLTKQEGRVPAENMQKDAFVVKMIEMAQRVDQLPPLITIQPRHLQAACLNGRIPIMDAVWKKKDQTPDTDDRILAAWQSLFNSPIGADSVEAHAWLHARAPIGPGVGNRELRPMSTTSIAWFYSLEPGPAWPELKVRDVPSAGMFCEMLRQRERRALPIVWYALGSSYRLKDEAKTTVLPVQLTLPEMQLVLRLAIPAGKGLDYTVRLWLFDGLPALTSPDVVNAVLAALYPPRDIELEFGEKDERLVELPKALYRKGLTTFSPVIRTIFDVIGNPEQIRAAYGRMAAAGLPDGLEKPYADECAALFLEAAAYIHSLSSSQ